jgi:ABC-type transport system involved in multi-copper enzyme maturation permease subunit
MTSLLTVVRWELRRLVADRATWLVVAFAVALCLGVAWIKHSWGRPVVDGVAGEMILIIGTTRVGLPYLMIEGLFVLFGPLIPFVATDGVAHDYRQRTDDLVLVTPVSTNAFVWGRYLAVLLVCLLMDLVLLGSVFVVGPLLHALDSRFPLPDEWLGVGVWMIAIVPGTIVIASVSFALGTAWPHLAGSLKLLPVVLWIGLVFLSDVVDHGGTWFTAFNPTSHGIVRVEVDQFLAAYQMAVTGVTDPTSRAETALLLQQTAPNLGLWVAPHLVLVGASFLLVAWTATRFGRIRGAPG